MRRRNGSLDHDAGAALAAALGVPASELAAALAPARLGAHLSALPPPERAVLAALAGLGGRGRDPVLVAEIADEIAGPGDDAAELADAAREALETAWERGLVARGRDGAVFLPAGLAAALREPLRESLGPGVPAPPPDLDEHGLLAVLAVALEAPLGLTRDARPYRRTLEAIRARLGPLLHDEDDAQEILRALADLGLLRVEDAALRADEVAAARWCAEPPARRTAALLASTAAGTDGVLLLRQWRSAAPDRALTARALARLVRRARLSERRPSDAAEAFGLLAVVEADTRAAVAALRRAGLAAATRAAGAPAFALTSAGRAFPAAVAGAAPESVHVGADLSVLVPRGLAPSVHLGVARLARLESADVVARYRLDRERVLAALDRGLSRGDVVEFLAEHARPALPRAVADDVARWCERFGEVIALEGVVLACTVEARRAELEAVVGRSGLRARIAGPGVAVVAPADHAALLAALRDAGFTPREQLERLGGPAQAVAAGAPVSPLPRWDDLPAWGELHPELDEAAPALPPPGSLLRMLQAKYRREVGSAGVAALEDLEPHELVRLEEAGQVRQYLEERARPATRADLGADLEAYRRDDLVPVPAGRARALLARAAADGLRLEVAYGGRAGRRTRVVVVPLAVTTDGPAGYVRARVVPTGEERMIALDQLQALRVVAGAAGRG